MFETPVRVVNLSGDSSRARHSKHGNPILKCRRCAKEEEERAKREGRMGCGYEPEEEVEETSEAAIDLGCKKCQDRARRKKIQNTTLMPSGALRLQGQGMLGQVPLARPMDTIWSQTALQGPMGNGGRGGRAFSYDIDHRMEYCDPTMDPDCPYPIVGQVVGPAVMAGTNCPGHARLGQACPAGAVPLDPTLNCQRDARGNTVCSNGLYFPPGCPKTPPEEYFSPGIAPDEVHGTILEAKVPPARGTPGAPPLVSGGGAAAPSAPGYSGGSNLLPYAAGAIAGLGLLYAIFR